MSESVNILVTGASGFIGSRLVERLRGGERYNVTTTTRRARKSRTSRCVKIANIDGDTNWHEALRDQKVVVHAAARAHVMDDMSSNPLDEYRKVNVYGTVNLAEQAIAAGVQRFIFLSSIKVNGEQTAPNRPFTHNTNPQPNDAYGVSKYEAEIALKELFNQHSAELVIIRPPLVYGPGVKANFASMIKLAKKNMPLPFGAINNSRSLVALDNLIDLLITCIEHPKAANELFLVSDNNDISTTELFKQIILLSGMQPRLLRVSPKLLKLLGKLIGKRALVERLCGNLQVDISHTRNRLGWEPPMTVEEGIRSCLK